MSHHFVVHFPDSEDGRIFTALKGSALLWSEIGAVRKLFLKQLDAQVDIDVPRNGFAHILEELHQLTMAKHLKVSFRVACLVADAIFALLMLEEQLHAWSLKRLEPAFNILLLSSGD